LVASAVITVFNVLGVMKSGDQVSNWLLAAVNRKSRESVKIILMSNNHFDDDDYTV
jgi:hypothetical protein